MQVAFFRALGRRYIVVGAPALAVALAAGGVLLAERPTDATTVAAVVMAAMLVLVTAVGVALARSMTRLRARALTAIGDEAFISRLRRGAIVAALLRMAIGVLSVALLAVASAMAG